MDWLAFYGKKAYRITVYSVDASNIQRLKDIIFKQLETVHNRVI
jgi:hypothetical protein